MILEREERMTIFDVDIRRDTDRKRISESVFDYMNHSAKPGNAMARDLIEEWIAHVPQFPSTRVCQSSV
jgi:hypothetical protein